MVRRNLKGAAFAFILGILFATSATAVFAASASSPYGYYGPYQGYSYKNMADIISGSGVWGYADVYNQTSDSVPTGYMGAEGRVFNSAGNLVASSNMKYNSSAASGLLVPSETYYSSGTYYSYGITAAYNGNGYNEYYTLKSPSINY